MISSISNNLFNHKGALTLFLLIVINVFANAQEYAERDSVIREICNTINEEHGSNDSIRLEAAYTKHLYPYLNRFNEKRWDQIWSEIYFRLQHDCKAFFDVLNRLSPPQNGAVFLSEMPPTNLSDSACMKFFKEEIIFYQEVNGDSVYITVDNNFWIDHFKNGTFSKLHLQIINPCEFDIIFVESNNNLRKNFSRPGDTYRYKIIDRKPTYYKMAVVISGTNRVELFKMFYKTKNKKD